MEPKDDTNIYVKQKQTSQIQKKAVLPKGRRKWRDKLGSMGLTDTDYYV